MIEGMNGNPCQLLQTKFGSLCILTIGTKNLLWVVGSKMENYLISDNESNT